MLSWHAPAPAGKGKAMGKRETCGKEMCLGLGFCSLQFLFLFE